MTRRPPRPSRVLVAATCSLTLLAAGCTADPEPAAEPSPQPSVGETATLEPRPVPLDVAVSSVAGRRIGKAQRRSVERRVGRLVTRYVDAAFLGSYPRKDFSAAWEVFTPGAARSAVRDRDLLTNAATGQVTEAVAERVKKVRIDLLVPRGSVVGATARIRLVFVQERTDVAPQRVTVAGRLLVTRTPRGDWQVFGYDLARSSVPVAKGAS